MSLGILYMLVILVCWKVEKTNRMTFMLLDHFTKETHTMEKKKTNSVSKPIVVCFYVAPCCLPWNSYLSPVTFRWLVTVPLFPSPYSASLPLPSSSSPLNFITFGQKRIYSPTKVIAALMEWASYAIDSLKSSVFLARMLCFLLKSHFSC